MCTRLPPVRCSEHMFGTILGLDPGLTTTGYGIVAIDGAHERAVTAGAIRTDPAAPIALRLSELHRDLTAIIAEHGPQAVAIEQVFVNRNRTTAMAVARASGVAMLAAADAGLAVAEYTPSAVKMALTGSGNAPKEQVARVVALRLGVPGIPGPADAADALAIALCHAQHAAIAAIEAPR